MSFVISSTFGEWYKDIWLQVSRNQIIGDKVRNNHGSTRHMSYSERLRGHCDDDFLKDLEGIIGRRMTLQVLKDVYILMLRFCEYVA